MTGASLTVGWTLLLVAVAGAAAGQQTGSQAAPDAKSSAQIDAGEPRANSPARSATKTAPASRTPGGPGAAPAAVASKGGGAADRLNLNTATVTGDREQPKVMYIVPWKSSSIGDPSGKPMNSLLDEALAPVDRDVFKREVAYYNVVRADARQNDAPAVPAKQVEK